MDRNLEAEMETELENELGSAQEFESESEYELEGEQELEHEAELEGESGEQFLGSLVSGLGSLLGGSGESQELEAELETELEGESESEFEGEFELEQGEQFFGKLLSRAPRLLKRLAGIAAPLVGKAVSGMLPGPFGALAGRGIKGLAGLLREQELEFEQEFEQEQELNEQEVSNELGEHELMAEMMAHHAAQASQELEAEALVGAATTLTLSAADRRALRRLVPHLVRGASLLTRLLRMSRATRPWVRMVPSVVRRTARTLRRSAASGRPITRAAAASTMAQQTRRVLSSPRYCAAAMRRNVRATRLTSRPVATASRRPRGI